MLNIEHTKVSKIIIFSYARIIKFYNGDLTYSNAIITIFAVVLFLIFYEDNSI